MYFYHISGLNIIVRALNIIKEVCFEIEITRKEPLSNKKRAISRIITAKGVKENKVVIITSAFGLKVRVIIKHQVPVSWHCGLLFFTTFHR